MPDTLETTTTLVRVSCWCGVQFAIPQNRYTWMQHSRKNDCHCPNGHTFHFAKTLEEERAEMQRELAEERRRKQAARDLLAAEERSHAATRGHLTRSRKRAAAAVCPCCNRSFVQLRRHMAAKHPDYVPS